MSLKSLRESMMIQAKAATSHSVNQKNYWIEIHINKAKLHIKSWHENDSNVTKKRKTLHAMKFQTKLGEGVSTEALTKIIIYDLSILYLSLSTDLVVFPNPFMVSK